MEQKNSSLWENGIYDDGPYEVGDESRLDPDLVPVPASSYLGESLTFTFHSSSSHPKTCNLRTSCDFVSQVFLKTSCWLMGEIWDFQCFCLDAEKYWHAREIYFMSINSSLFCVVQILVCGIIVILFMTCISSNLHHQLVCQSPSLQSTKNNICFVAPTSCFMALRGNFLNANFKNLFFDLSVIWSLCCYHESTFYPCVQCSSVTSHFIYLFRFIYMGQLFKYYSGAQPNQSFQNDL